MRGRLRWEGLLLFGLACWLLSLLARLAGLPGTTWWLGLAVLGAFVMITALISWWQVRRQRRG